MIPLCGTSTGAGSKASPNLQAWYDRKVEAEEKRKAIEGIPGELLTARLRSTNLEKKDFADSR